MSDKHLWEVDHPYYCNEGNYFARESCCSKYRSWTDFVEEEGDSDLDMNLVFRGDWKEAEDDYGNKIPFNGNVNYRNGRLLIFWMGQRKGLYRYSTIEVCRADEPAIRAWLQLRYDHLKTLWEPLP